MIQPQIVAYTPHAAKPPTSLPLCRGVSESQDILEFISCVAKCITTPCFHFKEKVMFWAVREQRPLSSALWPLYKGAVRFTVVFYFILSSFITSHFCMCVGLLCMETYYRTPWTAEALRKVLFLAPSVCFFSLCMKYFGNRWTDLRQIHMEDVFGPSLGRVWRSRSKVKVIRDKNGIFRPVVYV